MFYNNSQVEAIAEKFGLSYRWIYPSEGASSIIIEECIEYKPFSNWIIDLRTNKKYHSNTVIIFKDLCKELAESKKNY